MTREEEISKAAEKELKDCPYINTSLIGFDFFIKGAEWADAHPHWISVEDELPKERQWVLVYGATSELAPIDTSCFDSKSTWEWLGITHWMPLPQPPKGGEE